MLINELFLKRIINPLKTSLVFLRKDGSSINYSWREYISNSLFIAEQLKLNRVNKGDFVALILANAPESFFALMGVILAGAVPIPLNIQLLKEPDQKELNKILIDCKPKFIITNQCLSSHFKTVNFLVIEDILRDSSINDCVSCSDDYAAYLCDIARTEINENDLLIMPYTSGTSGNPKGVMLSHKNIINRLEAIITTLAATKNDRFLSYLPLGHIAELITTFFGQVYGGYVIYFTEYAQKVLENREEFRKNFPIILQQVKPTIFVGVPKIWMSFREGIETKIQAIGLFNTILPHWFKTIAVKKNLGFGQTKVFISAGSKISSGDLAFFGGFGVNITDIFGQTEIAGPITVNGMGIGINNKVALENGEITVTGDCVMAGYFQNDSANAKVFAKDAAGNVIYHTGDTGIMYKGKIIWNGRIDDEEKHPNGEKINTAKREIVEGKIKKIDTRIDEVIITASGRSHLTAFIFSEHNEDNDLHQKISAGLSQIEDGLYRPRRFALINTKELELTPTMKVKRKTMLKKLEQNTGELC